MRQEDWEVLLAKQGGVCAMCGGQNPNEVDHDHQCCPGRDSCGKCVRGILCKKCNWRVGWYENMHNESKTQDITAYLAQGPVVNG